MKILVIDDSQIVRFITTKMLQEMGYNSIVSAGDVESALVEIEKSKPDLILSDMNMPGKNGLDLLKHIRSIPEYTDIPFVIISTFQESDAIVEAIKEGAQHYLKKPIDQNELREKMKALSYSHGIKPPL